MVIYRMSGPVALAVVVGCTLTALCLKTLLLCFFCNMVMKCLSYDHLRLFDTIILLLHITLERRS